MAAKKGTKADKNPKKPAKSAAPSSDAKKEPKKKDKSSTAAKSASRTPKKPMATQQKNTPKASSAPAKQVQAQSTAKGKAKSEKSDTKDAKGRKGAKAAAAPASKKVMSRTPTAQAGASKSKGSSGAGSPRGGATGSRRKHSELTPKIVAKLRQKLLEKHRDLVGAVTSSKGDSREKTSDGTEDYIDYAVSSYDREFLLSLTELEQRELRRVEEALRRIDRGEYGFCQASGEEIPLKRLEVQPWARYCLRVQELEDQGLLNQDDFESAGDSDEDSSLEESDYEDLEGEEEAEEEEDELHYRDEIPSDDSLSDPDTEERVV